MRLGSFELIEPIPQLKAPHALAILQPWIDAGNVGTLVLERLENAFGALDLGRLARPGSFFDFTRYRPRLVSKQGIRELSIPNTRITYAKRETGDDFLFLHLLEPHNLSETYIKSILALLKMLNVQSYCLIGSMYDMVPHTRPIQITGGASGKRTTRELESAGIQFSNYHGPTTICHLISQEATVLGIDTMSLIAHLPQYSEVEEDWMGVVALLKVLRPIYGIPVGQPEIHKAEKQSEAIDEAAKNNRKLKGVIAQLEEHYDAHLAARKKEESPRLSPEVEQFLNEMEKRYGGGGKSP